MTPDKRVEEIVRQFQSLFCRQSIMEVDAQNEITDWLEQALTQHHQDMIEDILKKARAILDAEMKVYGTDKHGLSYVKLY